MSKKEFVKEYVATAATVLCLTDEYYGTGRIVAANSWFGLVKSANALMQKELYANMLVKAAQKGFLRDQLNEKNFLQEIGLHIMLQLMLQTCCLELY